MADSEVQINVRALAELSRLEVTDAEVAKLEQELPEILSFVKTIQSVDVSKAAQDTSLRNVMREDKDPHEGGIYSEELIAAAPSHTRDRIAVKQVVSRTKPAGGSQ